MHFMNNLPKYTDTEIKTLLQSLEPIIKAIDINDSDTLSLCVNDEKIIFRAESSWSGNAVITIGDLRRIKKAVLNLKI